MQREVGPAVDPQSLIAFMTSIPSCTQSGMPEKKAGVVRILCLGDVVGRPGRLALKERLGILKKQYSVDVAIVNGENSAGGIGITPATVKELRSAGADAITTGNHVWRHQSVYGLLDQAEDITRPANFSQDAPGKGVVVLSVGLGKRSGLSSPHAAMDADEAVFAGSSCEIAVINLVGRIYMDAAECPFRAADVLLAGLPQSVRMIIVDFHAEATSEKRAMSHYLDGRVSAVFGTHTHVQTADAMILPGGTASLTDLGMCGVEDASVIGMRADHVVRRFLTGLPCPFTPARGRLSLNGALVDVDAASGRAVAMALVREHI